MWNRLTGYPADSPQEETEASGSVVLPDDVKDQLEQHQVLIEHLKLMVRENENQIKDKEKLLEESNSKFQNFKLKSKAKISQLTTQLKERSTSEKSTEESDENNPKMPKSSGGSASATDYGSRGKMLLLKKQLEESKLKFEEREKTMQADRLNLESAVEHLQKQLIEVKDNDSAVNVKASPKRSVEQTIEKDAKEMYAQIVYKDTKIMDLNNQILALERQILDLQEHVHEKDEVLSSRNKAIQLMSEDLSKRGKKAVDNLDDTRSEMRLMQENFAQLEVKWNLERNTLKEVFNVEKEKFMTELNEKDEKLKQVEVAMKNLEQIRFELASRNAELQEKVVLVQDSFEKWKQNHDQKNEFELTSLKKELEEKNLEIKNLHKNIEETNNSLDTKILKARAKERSKLKSLQREMDELKKNDKSLEKITELEKRVAETEEEKGTLLLKVMELEEQWKSEDKWTLERSTLDQSMAIQETESSALNDQIISLKIENTKLAKQLEQKDEDSSKIIVTLQTENNNLKVSLDSTEEEYASYKNLVNDLELKMEAYDKHIQMLEANQHTLSEEIVSKEHIVSELQHALKTVQEDKIALELKIIEFEEQREADDKVKDDFQREIKRLNKKIEDEQIPVLEIEREKESLEKELIEVRKSDDMKEKHLKEMEIKIIELTYQLEQSNQSSITLEKTIIDLDTEITAKQTEIEEFNREMSAKNCLLKENEKTITDLNERIDLFCGKCARENLEDVFVDWEMLKSQIELLEKENSFKIVEIENSTKTQKDLEKQLLEAQGELKTKFNYLEKNRIKIEELDRIIFEKDSIIKEQIDLTETRDQTIEDCNLESKRLLRELDAAKELQSSEGSKVETKMNFLLEQVSEMETELSSLQNRFESKTNDTITLSNELENVKITFNQNNEEMNKMRDQIKRQTEEIDNFQYLLREKEIALENLTLENNERKIVNSKLQGTLEILSGEKEKLLAENEIYQNDLSNKTEKELTIEQQANTLSQNLQIRNQTIEIHEQSIASLQDDIEKLSENILTANFRNEELKAELLNVIKEKEYFEESISSKNMALEETNSRLDSLLCDHDELTNKMSAEIKAAYSKVDELRDELHNLNEERKLVLLEKQHNESVYSDIQEQVKTFELKNHSLETLNMKLENELTEYRSSINNLEEQLQLVQSSTSHNESLISNYNSIISELQKQITIFTNEKETLIAENETLSSENDAAILKLSALTDQNSSIIRELSRTSNDILSTLDSIQLEDETLINSAIELPIDSPPLYAEYFHQIANIHSKIKVLKANLSTKNSNLEKVETIQSSFTKSIEDLTTEKDKLYDVNQKLIERIKEISTNLEITTEKLHISENVINALENSQKELETDKLRLEGIISASVDELNLIREEKEALRIMSDSISSEISNNNEILEAYKTKLNVESQTQHEIEVKNQNLEAELADINSKFAVLNQRYHQLGSEAEQQLKRFEEEFGSCSVNLETKERKIKELEREILDSNDATNKMRESFKEVQREFAQMVQESKDSSERLISLNKEMDTLRSFSQENEAKWKTLNDENSSLNNKVEQYEVDMTDLKSSRAVLETENLGLKELEKELLTRIETCKLEFNQTEIRLGNEKLLLNDQLQTLQEQFEIALRDKQNYNSQVEMYQKQCDELKNGADENVQSMCSQLESTRSQIISLESDISKLETDKQKLKMEMQQNELQLSEEIKNLKIEIEKSDVNHKDIEQFANKINCLLKDKTEDFDKLKIEAKSIEDLNVELRNKISTMSEEITNYQLLNNSQQSDIFEKVEINNSMSLELDLLQTSLTEMRNKLITTDSELQNKSLFMENLIESQTRDLSNRTDVLETELDERNTEISLLKSTKEEMQNELSAKNETISEFITKIDTLQVNLSNALEDNATLDSNMIEMMSEMGDLKIAMDEKIQLEIILKEHETEIKLQQSGIEGLTAQLMMLKEELEIKKNEFRISNNKLKEDIESLSDVVIEKDRIITILEESLGDGKTTEIQSSAEVLSEEISSLKKERDTNKSKMGKMLLKLKQFKEKNDKLSKELNDSNQSIANNSDLENLKDDLSKLRVENRYQTEKIQLLESTEESLSKSEDSIAFLNTQTEQLVTEKEELVDQNSRLTSELQCLQEQCVALQINLKEFSNNQESIESQNKSLKNELVRLKEQSEMLSTDNETFQGLVEHLKLSEKRLKADLLKQKDIYSKTVKEKENELQIVLDKLCKAELIVKENQSLIDAITDDKKALTIKMEQHVSDLNKEHQKLFEIMQEKQKMEFENDQLKRQLLELEDQQKNPNENEGLEMKEQVMKRELETLQMDYQNLREEYTRNQHRVEESILVKGAKEAPNETEQLLEKKMNQLQSENSNFQKCYVELENTNKRLSQEIDFLKGNRIELEQNVLSEIEKVKGSTQQQRQLLQELQIARQEMETRSLTTERLTEENRQLNKHLHDIETEKNAIVRQVNEYEIHCRQLTIDKQRIEKQLQELSQSNAKYRVEQVRLELQQAMETIHQQGLRCEDLNLEISKLIEERDQAQQQLVQRTAQTMQRRESTLNASQAVETFVSVNMDNQVMGSSMNSSLRQGFDIEESLQEQVIELKQQLLETEMSRCKLQSSNEILENTLAREQQRRHLVEEELTYAQEQIGTDLRLSSNKDEYHLLLEEEPEMIPETDFSISRQVKTHTDRAKRWLHGRRNYLSRMMRRKSRTQLVFVVYLILVHAWLLACVF